MEIVESGGDDTAIIVEAAVEAALADHKADMATETADEALAVAEAALVVASTPDHVCRCDEVEAALTARLMALEGTVAEVEDIAVAEAIVAEEEAVHPAPPVKEAPVEPEAEKPSGSAAPKRSGVSKGWFGSRAR